MRAGFRRGAAPPLGAAPGLHVVQGARRPRAPGARPHLLVRPVRYAWPLPRPGAVLRPPGRRARKGDAFDVVETVSDVLPGSGSVAVTKRISNLAAGSWQVTSSAQCADLSHATPGGQAGERDRHRLDRLRAGHPRLRSISTRTSPAVTSASVTPGRRRRASARPALCAHDRCLTDHSTCPYFSELRPAGLGDAADARHIGRRRVVVQVQARRRAVGRLHHMHVLQAARTTQGRGEALLAVIAGRRAAAVAGRARPCRSSNARAAPMPDVLDAQVQEEPDVRIVKAVEDLPPGRTVTEPRRR